MKIFFLKKKHKKTKTKTKQNRMQLLTFSDWQEHTTPISKTFKILKLHNFISIKFFKAVQLNLF